MITKKKLKILPLQFWMTSKFSFPEYLSEQEIKPILNKDGYYFSRKGWYYKNGYYKWQDEYSWFEYNGKAYWYSVDSFKFELSTLNASEFSERDMLLLSQVSTKYLNKKQKDMLYLWELDRNTRFSCRHSRKSFVKRWAKFKNKIRIKD